MTSAQQPFTVRRDGTLVDRETGEVIGRVWFDEFDGWFVDTPQTQFGPNRPRGLVCQAAWTWWSKARENERCEPH